MPKPTSVQKIKPTFANVLDWYNKHLHPDSNAYDDQEVYKHVYHDGTWAGVFQATSSGAQRLFNQAKPTNTVDIATVTSIYRPGPLAANVDKIYLKSKGGEKLEWGHPLFEKVLGETYNCIIFQESVMDLAEHVGGFPKEKCDDVRKAIMKRSISGGEEAKKKAAAMEDAFVKGAVERGIELSTARKAYQNILYMSGYGFNRAHAVAYAIDSYMCAWLLTHFEEDWICTYLESMSSTPEGRARAFSEAKALGWTITQIDINDATYTWTALSGKKLMPSFLSCKGVGQSAIEEILQNRPYRNLSEMLWNEDGTWRHSKFNKKALESLIKIGAFSSLDCVGKDKIFRNYRVMYEVLIENSDLIKKSLKRDKFLGMNTAYLIASELNDKLEDWTPTEKAQNMIDVFGSFDASAVVSGKMLKLLEEKEITSVDHLEEGSGIHWFIVASVAVKKTKTQKEYYALQVMGENGIMMKLNVWGKKPGHMIDLYTLWLAEIEKNDSGLSTTTWKMKQVKSDDD